MGLPENVLPFTLNVSLVLSKETSFSSYDFYWLRQAG
jgi:hypothetical protein